MYPQVIRLTYVSSWKIIVSFTVLLLSCFGYWGDTSRAIFVHFVPFTQLAHSSAVHIAMGVLPNLKRLTCNILKCHELKQTGSTTLVARAVSSRDRRGFSFKMPKQAHTHTHTWMRIDFPIQANANLQNSKLVPLVTGNLLNCSDIIFYHKT